MTLIYYNKKIWNKSAKREGAWSEQRRPDTSSQESSHAESYTMCLILSASNDNICEMPSTRKIIWAWESRDLTGGWSHRQSLPQFSSVQFIRSVVFDSLRLHESQHARPPCPSPTRSSLRLTSIESVMPSSHLILCRPLFLLPPIPPSIKIFSSESTLRMRWPKYS